MYKKTYSEEGVLLTIHQENGLILPFNPLDKTFDENNTLTIELRKWEEINGVLDLSDLLKPEQSLTDLKKELQYQIIEAAKQFQSNLVADYSATEQNTWDRKISEAKAIILSKNIDDAPLLKIESSEFNVTSTDEEILAATINLAEIILSKSEELYAISARITGRRTKIWNLIEAASTKEDLPIKLINEFLNYGYSS